MIYRVTFTKIRVQNIENIFYLNDSLNDNLRVPLERSRCSYSAIYGIDEASRMRKISHLRREEMLTAGLEGREDGLFGERSAVRW